MYDSANPIEPQPTRSDLIKKLLTPSRCAFLSTKPLVWRQQANVLWVALAHHCKDNGEGHEYRQIVCYELGSNFHGWQVIGAWAENEDPPHLDCPDAVLRVVPATFTAWRHRVCEAQIKELDRKILQTRVAPIHAAI